MPWKHRPVQGPPQCVPCSLKSLCPVGLGKIFGRELQPRCWCGYRKWVATDVKTRHLRIVWNLHVPWPMAAGIGEAFSKPFLASVFASRPSCLYLNWRQKVYPKLKPFLASDFSLLAGSLAPCTMHKATNIFVETLYSVFACACKQAELIGLPPVNWTTDRLRYICFCFWDARRTQGGVLELVRNFRDVLRSWLWRRNPVQWLWSYECIGCRHLLFWEFVLRGLRELSAQDFEACVRSGCCDFHISMAVVFSCRPSCCWRPGLFELWRGTLARTWAFWILPSLTRSSVAAF